MADTKNRNKVYNAVKEYYKDHIANKEKNGIPVSGKKFDEKEIINLVNAALDCHWTEGEFAKKFALKFSKYTNIKHTVLVNSGSSANLIALTTLTDKSLKNHLEPGDEVITLAAGFPTTINPIIQIGCIPVFIDVKDVETMDVEICKLKKALSRKTKAVILAHTLGMSFNARKVREFCNDNNLWFIEDCCDALGSELGNKKVGTFGDIATFSFYPAHQITTGEGGAVCTNNNKLSVIAESLRDWGRSCRCRTGEDNRCGRRFSWKIDDVCYDHKYIYDRIGYNMKMTDFNAAIGLAQMNKIEEFTKTRRRNYKLLYEKMWVFRDYFHLPKAIRGSKPSWFGFMMTIKKDAPFNREELLKFLNKKNIGVRLLFAGDIRIQPSFKGVVYKTIGGMWNTENIARHSFWIGVGPLIDEKDIDKIYSAFSEFVGEVYDYV